MKLATKNPHLETQQQYSHFYADRIKTRLDIQTLILDPSLYRKVKNKNEIKITRSQLCELSSLYKHAYLKKPGWLRTRFGINQYRRKQLNTILVESGLGKHWCGNCCDMEDWAGMLHCFWHEINGRPLCK